MVRGQTYVIWLDWVRFLIPLNLDHFSLIQIESKHQGLMNLHSMRFMSLGYTWILLSRPRTIVQREITWAEANHNTLFRQNPRRVGCDKSEWEAGEHGLIWKTSQG